MTTNKSRTFPLPLSSVVSPDQKVQYQGAITNQKLVASQTASRNRLHGWSSEVVRPSGAGGSPSAISSNPDAFHTGSLVSEAVRHAMVERLADQGVQDRKVLAAMAVAPRHLFVDSALASQAYIDASLPIGHQQTISQPYIVARMIEILRNQGQGGELNKVLEIGTGCGYQALVLSKVAREVYSIERIKGLHELAKSRLRPLRVPNIRLHYGDGMLGLPQAAPFEGIILAAAGLEVPQALLEQLTIGGRLVAPVGGAQQALQLIERLGENEWRTTMLENCFFVPLREGRV